MQSDDSATNELLSTLTLDSESQNVLAESTMADDVDENNQCPSKTISDIMLEEADRFRIKAQRKLSEGAFDEAITLFGKAIENNPQLAILFAKRAQCYIKLQKPEIAILDCDRALNINENSQQALKWRGKAHRLLEHWEDAHQDFCRAQLSDFDEEVQVWTREVEVHLKEMSEYRRKHQQRQEEKAAQRKKDLIQQAQEAYARAEREEAERRLKKQHARFYEAQYFLGNLDFIGLDLIINDPEILQVLEDSEVQRVFADVSSDPSTIAAHQHNPKVHRIMQKLSEQFEDTRQFTGEPVVNSHFFVVN